MYLVNMRPVALVLTFFGCARANKFPKCSSGFCERLDNNNCMECPTEPNGICNFSDCRPRRSLSASATSFQGTEPEFRAHAVACAGYDYDSFLFVDSHLYAVASPKEDAVTAGCPFVVVHAILQDHSGEARKEILIWEGKEEGLSVFPETESILIGTFKFSELVRAYKEADPSAGSSSYDLIGNNCGNFMVSLGARLGVKIDSRVTTYIARRLLEESGKALVNRLTTNVNYKSLFKSRHLRSKPATDEEVVKLLVETQASALFS